MPTTSPRFRSHKGTKGRLRFSETEWTGISYTSEVRHLGRRMARAYGGVTAWPKGTKVTITFSVPVPSELPSEVQAPSDSATYCAEQVAFVQDDRTVLEGSLSFSYGDTDSVLHCTFISQTT